MPPKSIAINTPKRAVKDIIEEAVRECSDVFSDEVIKRMSEGYHEQLFITLERRRKGVVVSAYFGFPDAKAKAEAVTLCDLILDDEAILCDSRKVALAFAAELESIAAEYRTRIAEYWDDPRTIERKGKQ